MAYESPVMAKESEPFLTKEQLVKTLNLPSIWWVDRMRKKGKIPHHPFGYRTKCYLASEVTRALGKLEKKESGFGRS